MKKFLYFIIAMLGFVSCTSDDTEGHAATAITTNIASSGVVLQAGESKTVKITLHPAEAIFRTGKLRLLDEGGKKPPYIVIEHKKNEGNTAEYYITDLRNNHQEYEYLLHLEYDDIASEPFTVRSAEIVEPEPITFKISTDKIIFSVGGSETINVTVTPSDSKFTVADIKLLNENDEESKNVEIDKREIKANIITFTLKDKRSVSTISSYSEQVRFVYEYDLIKEARSELFTVSSAPSLPIVYITTGVPQGSINKTTWVDGKIRIDGGGTFKDLAEVDTKVKGRGNSTWSWEKKPYALKLDKKQEIIGYPKHKRWCLIANYMDKTDMRNRVAYHIAANTNLEYTVGNDFAELYFNGSYQGLYLLTEQIKEDENRVNITEVDEKSTTTSPSDIGYLLEFDTNYDEAGKFTSATTRIPVNIKYPDREDFLDAGNDSQFQKYLNYIKNEVDAIDKAIYELASGGKTSAVWEKLDRESMVEFWIVFEIMGNREILWPKSVYFHKDKGGKLKAGPVWDFDWGTLKYVDRQTWTNYNLGNVEHTWGKNNWWNALLKYDPEFKAAVKSRWQALYPFLQTVPSFIDEEKAKIADAEVRNRTKWPNITGPGNPNGDEYLSFDEAVAQLKSIYSTRISWINSQISGW